MNKESIYEYVKNKCIEYGEINDEHKDVWSLYLLPVVEAAKGFAKNFKDIDIIVVELAALLHCIAPLENYMTSIQEWQKKSAVRSVNLIGNDLPKEQVAQIKKCILNYWEKHETDNLSDEVVCLSNAVAKVNIDKMSELLNFKKQEGEKLSEAIKAEIRQISDSYSMMSLELKEEYQKKYKLCISVLNAKLYAINEEALGSITNGRTGIAIQECGCN